MVALHSKDRIFHPHRHPPADHHDEKREAELPAAIDTFLRDTAAQ
jgi:hypothetical protein